EGTHRRALHVAAGARQSIGARRAIGAADTAVVRVVVHPLFAAVAQLVAVAVGEVVGAVAIAQAGGAAPGRHVERPHLRAGHVAPGARQSIGARRAVGAADTAVVRVVVYPLFAAVAQLVAVTVSEVAGAVAVAQAGAAAPRRHVECPHLRAGHLATGAG